VRGDGLLGIILPGSAGVSTGLDVQQCASLNTPSAVVRIRLRAPHTA